MNSGISAPPPQTLQWQYATGGGSPANTTFTADSSTIASIATLKFSAFCLNQSNVQPLLKNILPGTALILVGSDNLVNAFTIATITAGTANQPVTFTVTLLRTNSTSLISGATYTLLQPSITPTLYVPATLPTADPHVLSAVWSNLGILTVSSG